MNLMDIRRKIWNHDAVKATAPGLTEKLPPLAEAGSVIVQITWFKYTKFRYGQGRRFFLRTPIHHHFELLGWYESQIVTRFYILCVLCAVVAFSTLKIR